MKKLMLLGVLCVCVGSSLAADTVFQIGKKDQSSAEFALYPNQYKKFLIDFGGVKNYAVGYSQAEKNWSYAILVRWIVGAAVDIGQDIILVISQLLISNWKKFPQKEPAP